MYLGPAIIFPAAENNGFTSKPLTLMVNVKLRLYTSCCVVCFSGYSMSIT
jgi:hypothetical protein